MEETEELVKVCPIKHSDGTLLFGFVGKMVVEFYPNKKGIGCATDSKDLEVLAKVVEIAEHTRKSEFPNAKYVPAAYVDRFLALINAGNKRRAHSKLLRMLKNIGYSAYLEEYVHEI